MSGRGYDERVAFKPDIVIIDQASKRPLVVIEAKLRIREGDEARIQEQLARYMVAARCPIGVLASPDRLLIFEDRLRTATPESIEQVADIDLRNVMGTPATSMSAAGSDALAFERALRNWFEKLAIDSYRDTLPQDLREQVEQYLMPSVITGEVRTTGPRWTVEATHGV